MSDQRPSASPEALQQGLGYIVDQSHAPLFFAGVNGVADVLEHCLWRLEQDGRDVSPIVVESRSRTLVLNVYEPAPVTIQVVQEEGFLERDTEILGTGIGLSVLAELRRVARILDLHLMPLSERFCRRFLNEQSTYVQTYSLFPGDLPQKQARFAEVLKGLQAKSRRETNLLRDLL